MQASVRFTILLALAAALAVGSSGCTPDQAEAPQKSPEHRVQPTPASPEAAQPSARPSAGEATAKPRQPAAAVEAPAAVERRPKYEHSEAFDKRRRRAGNAPVGERRAKGADGGDAAAAPKITCAEPVYDFGHVQQGETVTHQFTLKNEGPGKLVLERADAG